ncbi:MAG TPA: type II toxin-antitoxin system RelE/ParE family toxin [Rhodospirillales bacterium]
MPGYRLSRRADRKLAAIYEYTFVHMGEAQADAYLLALESTFTLLAARPQLGRPFYEYRRHEHGAHVIFYRLRRGGILIVDLLHRREDAEKIRT